MASLFYCVRIFYHMANTPVTPLQLSNSAFSSQVVVDGTSYSGADIKAVIHVYGKEAIDSRIEQLEQRVNILLAQNAQFTTVNGVSVPVLTEAQRATNSVIIAALHEEIEFLRSGKAPFVTKTLAEIQTLSVSTYREKYPVRSLTSTYPKGFTRGPRTIAGSMVFTVFDKNVLYEILEADPTEFDADKVFTTAIIDQLPPFDITISFANEMGQLSRMSIYGVEFVSEGQTMSIHDLFIENQCQYVARDIDPMTRDGDLRRRVFTPGTKLASDLLKEENAQQYKSSTDPFQSFLHRNNPFK